MTDRRKARDLLRRLTGNPNADFHNGQLEAIEGLVARHERRMVVERTGWGKSAVYFIATKMLRCRERGATLIVSPLLSLMRNQIASARKLGLSVNSIDSTNTAEWDRIEALVGEDKMDALLISPERLSNDRFYGKVLSVLGDNIGLLVVDEAHLISDWGHDFRPDYRRLVNVLKAMPGNLPILATTATANDRVIEDVEAQLPGIKVHRGPLARKNLALQTVCLPDQSARLAWLAKTIPSLPHSGIVYTLTIPDAEQVARWLSMNGINARAYHSKVKHPDFLDEDGAFDTDAYRRHLEDALYNNEIDALVATTALGMGYDKPDLGFVIHYQSPGSVIAYYQQVGRAGRGIDSAVGVLLTGREAEKVHEYFRRSAFPSEEAVKTILTALSESDEGMSVKQLEEAVNLRQGQIEKVLKYLSVENPSPVMKVGSKWRHTGIAYEMDHARNARLTRQREEEWAEISEYATTDKCLMAFLTEALNDPDCEPCGICANCTGTDVVPSDFEQSKAVEAARFLKVAEMPLQPRRQVRGTPFQEQELNGNLAPHMQAEEGRILSRWQDAGWGSMVAEDKRNNRFRDELVAAMAEMILERWKPEPFPGWVTCVPSNRHPELVPDFARRVAERLGLPFVDAVTKVKDNEAQKLQQNSFHDRAQDGGVRAAVSPGFPAGSCRWLSWPRRPTRAWYLRSPRSSWPGSCSGSAGRPTRRSVPAAARRPGA